MSLPLSPETPEMPEPSAPAPQLSSPSPVSFSSAAPVENPWSEGGSAAFPFIRSLIKKSSRNHILLDICLLIGWALLLVFGTGPILANGLSIRGIIIALCVVIGVPIYAIGNLIKNINYQNNPQKHPALQFASVGPPFQVAEHIDREISRETDHVRIGPTLFTPSWLLRYSSWRVEALLLSEVVWAYKKQTTHKTYGITTGKTYSLQVWAQSGAGMTVESIPEKKVDEILQFMETRTPWALRGYSDELNASWTKNRSDVVQAVINRKAEIEAGEKAALPGAQA